MISPVGISWILSSIMAPVPVLSSKVTLLSFKSQNKVWCFSPLRCTREHRLMAERQKKNKKVPPFPLILS